MCVHAYVLDDARVSAGVDVGMQCRVLNTSLCSTVSLHWPVCIYAFYSRPPLTRSSHMYSNNFTAKIPFHGTGFYRLSFLF